MPNTPKKRRVTGVPEHYQADVERLIRILKSFEDAPLDTYTNRAHMRLHKQCRRLFQDLLDTDY